MMNQPNADEPHGVLLPHLQWAIAHVHISCPHLWPHLETHHLKPLHLSPQLLSFQCMTTASHPATSSEEGSRASEQQRTSGLISPCSFALSLSSPRLVQPRTH